MNQYNLPILRRFNFLSFTGTLIPQRNQGYAEVKLEKAGCYCRKRRRGAAAVEFAIVAPIFFMLFCGMIEFGRAIMVEQIITNAAREGARVAVLDGASTTSVTTQVTNYLTSANLGNAGATVSVSVAAPGSTTFTVADPSTAVYGGSIQVTVSVNYGSISWIPSSMFISAGSTTASSQLTASCAMRRETVQ
jgi:Flp pilus assembly protein TadG